MPTPLTAAETLDRARTALQDGRGAGLPELLKLIETLSTDLAKATVTEIAELIERDAAVLCRVLTVANTIAHNPNIAPMASITQAVHQIGFHRVRNLAVSLMLLESSGGASNPPEQREAATRALCSSLMAQNCARSLGTVDPELAFTCAALRHFGDIILPAVSLDHYRRAREKAQTQPEDSAFREEFGLTPLELSRELAGFARLSPEVMQSLRECQPERMGGAAATTYGARLLSVADLGGRMARLALDGDGSDFSAGSQAVAEKFERLLPGVRISIESAFVRTVEHVTALARSPGSAGSTTPGLRRLQARFQKLLREAEKEDGADCGTRDAPAPAAESGADSKTSPSVNGTTRPSPPLPKPAAPAPPTPSSEDWREKLAASHVLDTARAEPAAEQSPWTATLAFVRESFHADECWILLPKSGGESLPIAQGVGPQCVQFRAKAAVRADERTVFGISLSRREHVVIHDTNEPSLAPYLPEWFRDAPVRPGAFLLMPLVRNNRIAGLAFVGWHQPHRINVTSAQTDIARQLLLTTLASQRTHAASPA